MHRTRRGAKRVVARWSMMIVGECCGQKSETVAVARVCSQAIEQRAPQAPQNGVTATAAGVHEGELLDLTTRWCMQTNSIQIEAEDHGQQGLHGRRGEPCRPGVLPERGRDQDSNRRDIRSMGFAGACLADRHWWASSLCRSLVGQRRQSDWRTSDRERVCE